MFSETVRAFAARQTNGSLALWAARAQQWLGSVALEAEACMLAPRPCRVRLSKGFRPQSCPCPWEAMSTSTRSFLPPFYRLPSVLYVLLACGWRQEQACVVRRLCSGASAKCPLLASPLQGLVPQDQPLSDQAHCEEQNRAGGRERKAGRGTPGGDHLQRQARLGPSTWELLLPLPGLLEGTVVRGKQT